MSDLIDRQAAIDVVDSETISTNPEHFKSSEKFIEFMDDSDISSFGKWQWSNGFNTALVAVRIGLKKLPSAQPDLSEYSDKLWRNAYERGKAEALPERTGKWIPTQNPQWKAYYHDKCSVCGWWNTKNAVCRDSKKKAHSLNYCPNCGARMLKEGEKSCD